MANISMMGTRLQCHPSEKAGFVDAIMVHVDRLDGGLLRLKYSLSGATEQIRFPETAEPDRTDELWKNTCFEMFCRRRDQDSYFEFNFAPSGQWAAYAFAGYRTGMAELSCAPPLISCTQDDDIFELAVELDLPESLHDVDAMAGFSAVIADTSGYISFWALAHPAGQPDFHHKDCFAFQLDARSAA